MPVRLVRASGQGLLFVFALIRFYFIRGTGIPVQRRDAAWVNRIRQRRAILSRMRVPTCTRC